MVNRDTQAVQDVNASTINARLAAVEAIVAGAGTAGPNPAWQNFGPPDGVVGVAFSYPFVGTGTPTPTYSIVAGTLPTGLSLNPTTGVLSGTPSTTVGSPFSFTIRLTNAAGILDVTVDIIIRAAPAATGDPLATAALARPGGGAWTLAFEDTFAGTSLDLTKWHPNWNFGVSDTTITPGSNGSEIAVMHPSLVTVANGLLTLGIEQGGPWTDYLGNVKSWRGSMIMTRSHYTYIHGFLECRMWLPGGTGPIPNWPAFWSDTTGTYPDGGEFDVMEGLNGDAKLTKQVDNVGGKFGSIAPPGHYTGWHTYAIHWQTNLLEWYYDGVRVAVCSTPVPSNVAHMIICNNTTGNNGAFGGVPTSGASIQVDYIRHWN